MTVSIHRLTTVAMAAGPVKGPDQLETDVFGTSAGDLKITFIGHGSLMFRLGSQFIHVDPYGKLFDYGQCPKADLILITHEHHDHLDPDAVAKLRSAKTAVVLSQSCTPNVKGGIVMKNGDSQTILGIGIEAVPAYNIQHTRDGKTPYHPKGIGNGYILMFGNKRVYVAGDTENIPEMDAIQDIDIAFLPMNLPFTMTPEMTAQAARTIQPKILYPYHYTDTDPDRIIQLLKDQPEIEVRIRALQ